MTNEETKVFEDEIRKEIETEKDKKNLVEKIVNKIDEKLDMNKNDITIERDAWREIVIALVCTMIGSMPVNKIVKIVCLFVGGGFSFLGGFDLGKVIGNKIARKIQKLQNR